jgi:hypothetical protein
MGEMKICCNCKILKPTAEFSSIVDNRLKNIPRLRSRCKVCFNLQARGYYKQDPERIKLNAKNYYWKNPEKLRMRTKKFREENKEAYAIWKKSWDKKYRATHKEECTERDRKYRKKNQSDLSDGYIKKLLTDRSKIKFHQIPKELVGAKRFNFLIKKHLEINNGKKCS